MNDDLTTFLAGVIIGVFLMGVVLLTPWSYHYKALHAIKECEKSLPRDQECKLIGIVITNDK